MATRRATKFSLGKVAPAPAEYRQANEAAFRRAIVQALDGIFVATNTVTLDTAGLTLLGWTHDLTFTADDHDTVSWSSGSIFLPNGTTYSIDAGNTGNMSTVTYIFLDTAVSSTVLQTTTTASAAVGANRILICVAQDVVSGKDAQFQVMGGADDSELVLLTADVIAANTITANEIAANTITAAEIAAGTITATQIAAGTITANEIAADTITANEIAASTITGTEISALSISGKTLVADTGTIGGWTLGASTISSGDVTLTAGTHPSIRFGSGVTYSTGTGLFAGRDSADGVYKLRIGTTTVYMRWNGTALQVSGASLASPAAGSAYTLLGWTQTCVFTATDADTVAWAAGSLTFSQGETHAISGGNTGNMTAGTTYYIYWDSAATTQYSATTTYTDAVGHGKVLVAVCRPASDSTEARFQVFGGTAGNFTLITADEIAANTITANEIAANTITASEIAANTITATQIAAGTITATEMSVATLSAISANLGTVTAGTIGAAVITASSSFTATSPTFTGSAVFEAGDGADRVIVGGEGTATTPVVEFYIGSSGSETLQARIRGYHEFMPVPSRRSISVMGVDSNSWVNLVPGSNVGLAYNSLVWGPGDKSWLVSHTGTTLETTLKTITILRNTLGANGGIRVKLWGTTAGANAKRDLRVKFDGNVVIDHEIKNTELGLWELEVEISNDGSAASQQGHARIIYDDGNLTSLVDATGLAVDTSTADRDVTVTCQLDNASDSLDIRGMIAEFTQPQN